MTTRARVTAAIVLILAIGALLIGLRACSADDGGGADDPGASSEPAPGESLAPVQMSTKQISEAIRTRLDERAGQPTRVKCPKRVEQKVGTTFECDVFFAEQPNTAAVSTATVEINGPDGAFVWEAVPN